MTKAHRRQGWFLVCCGLLMGLMCFTAAETVLLGVLFFVICSFLAGAIFGIYLVDEMDDGKFL